MTEITKGIWTTDICSINETMDKNLIVKMDDEVICIVTKEAFINDEETANAQLIAEAGTVKNETGFSPRQLANQKAELLEALEAMYNTYPAHARSTSEKRKTATKLAEQAIKNSK